MYGEEKKKNWTSIVIIVLLIILIGVGGVLIYRSFSDDRQVTNEDSSENKKEENNDNSDDSSIIRELSLLEIKEKDIEKLYNSIYLDGYNMGAGNYYYHTSSLRYVEDMTYDFKLTLVNNYIKESDDYSQYKNSNGDYEVDESIYKDAYRKMFGNDLYNFTEIKSACPGVSKLSSGLIYISTQCGDTALPSVKTAMTKVLENTSNNELYIYEVVGFFKYLEQVDSSGNDLADLYKDFSYNEKAVDNVTYDVDLYKYNDKLYSYKYTFKYDDVNNDYYFYSVEKVSS